MTWEPELEAVCLNGKEVATGHRTNRFIKKRAGRCWSREISPCIHAGRAMQHLRKNHGLIDITAWGDSEPAKLTHWWAKGVLLLVLRVWAETLIRPGSSHLVLMKKGHGGGCLRLCLALHPKMIPMGHLG